MTVIIQASNNGESGESLNILAIWTEIPPSIRICLRAAPPPITNNSIAIDLTESAIDTAISEFFLRCIQPIVTKAKSSEIIMADTGLPINIITFSTKLDG